VEIEQLLRSNFAERAGVVAVPGPDLHDAVVAGYRRQRRHRAGIAAGVVAVALLLLAVPWARGLLPTGGDVADREPTPSTRALDLYDVPTRGSLAGDAGLVAEITGLSWDDGVPRDPGQSVEPPESTRRVLFVGEVADGRVWALVEGTIRGRTVFAWFSGPADGAMTLAWGPDYAFPDTPLALTDTASDPGPLVVVTKPGDEVLVTPLGTDGTPAEPPRSLETVDGIAVGTVEVPVWPGFVEVQVLRDGEVVYRTVPQQFSSAADPAGGNDGVAADPYVLLMSECLSQRGFEVTPHPDGSFSYGPARGDPAVEVAYDTAVRECSQELGYK
jgi:hypothetical protein